MRFECVAEFTAIDVVVHASVRMPRCMGVVEQDLGRRPVAEDTERGRMLVRFAFIPLIDLRLSSFGIHSNEKRI